MSLFKDIPHFDLKPDGTRTLSSRSWQDYFRLLWWTFFFPQALRDDVARHDQNQAQRQTLLQMAATLLVVLLFFTQAIIVLVQRIFIELATAAICQGVASGVVCGGGIAITAFFCARSSETYAAAKGLIGVLGEAVWHFLKPRLRPFVHTVLHSALRRFLQSVMQQLYRLLAAKTEAKQGSSTSVGDKPKQPSTPPFAWYLVFGVAGGATGALAGNLLLTPIFNHTLVGWATMLLYGVWVGSGVGVTLNILIAVSEKPEQRRRTISRRNLWGALFTAPLMIVLQSIANREAFIDLRPATLGMAGVGALVFYLSAWWAAKRPLDWLLHIDALNRQLKKDASQLTPPHVTLFPLRNLQRCLESWLATDWGGGLKNAYQLWSYTYQYPQITAALHNVLKPLSDDQQVAFVTRFVDTKDDHGRGYPWPMILYHMRWRSKTVVKFSTAKGDAPATEISPYVQARRDEITRRLVGKQTPPLLPLDTAAQTAVAGFWYLCHGFVPASVIAFTQLPNDALSQELQSLVNSFYILLYKEKLLNQPRVELPARPKEPKRKATWDALDELKIVIRYGWLYKQCTEKSKRTAIMDLAHQTLAKLASNDKIARPDRLAILAIIKLWLEDLKKWQRAQHKADHMTPCNPYICFEPIRTQPPFAGREGMVKQLLQAWTQGTRQPVLLYGHAQTGKTSLVQRARDAHKEHTLVVPIHLAVVRKNGSLINRILWTMHQAIGDATRIGVDEQEFLTDPYAYAERQIRTVCGNLKRTLVLVVDEFDLAYRDQARGSVTSSGNLLPDVPATQKLLEFWWHLYRSIHNLSFVFVVQAPVDDFPQSAFSEHLWLLPVEELDKEAVAKVLTKPNPDFSPLFTPDAVEHIYAQTQGQPYLVQLLGHLTMQSFNGGLAKDPQPSPVFNPSDVDAVLTTAQYRQCIDHHVARIQCQLKAAHPGCEPVLRAIAQPPDGITTADLEKSLAGAWPWKELKEILAILQTHGVVRLVEAKWQVVGELLRREFT
ncbi:MAG: ATP-binding protein [Caldilineaceae bacterium]